MRPSCTRPITSRESHAPRFACVACRPRRSSTLAADPACDSARPFGSFLDVYSLSGYMPRRFKYISKVENLRLPIIGWAMSMAQHITLGRADRASQVKTLKDAIESLSNGNSLVVFPEVSTPRLASPCAFVDVSPLIDSAHVACSLRHLSGNPFEGRPDRLIQKGRLHDGGARWASRRADHNYWDALVPTARPRWTRCRHPKRRADRRPPTPRPAQRRQGGAGCDGQGKGGGHVGPPALNDASRRLSSNAIASTRCCEWESAGVMCGPWPDATSAVFVCVCCERFDSRVDRCPRMATGAAARGRSRRSRA